MTLVAILIVATLMVFFWRFTIAALAVLILVLLILGIVAAMHTDAFNSTAHIPTVAAERVR